MNDPFKMTSTEKRSAMALSLIYFLRMMGLFMILPVMAIYAEGLTGATPLLIGLAVGIYGLTQAMFQIPFGMLSDRFGRKPVIAAGLLIFAAGSLIAALSTSIEGVILGRVLQGAGAVASAIMALAADLTREEQRTKVMALIGISIGLSFSIAFIVGPLLLGLVNGNGIFVVSALLALVAIAVLYLMLPNPKSHQFHRECQPAATQLSSVLSDSRLLRLNSGIFTLHLILTACFVVIPLHMRDGIGLDISEHWQIYVPVFITSVILMMPFLRMAESKGRTREIFLGAIVLLSASLLGIYLTASTVLSMALWLVVFFTAFNLLEANLPSLISRTAAADSRGTAMGVYSTSQFAGTFIGGVAGGWVYGNYGIDSVFLFCTVLAGLWLVLALGMSFPRHLNSYMIHIGQMSEDQAGVLALELQQIPGVAEAMVVCEDAIAYLKIDSKQVDMEILRKYSVVED